MGYWGGGWGAVSSKLLRHPSIPNCMVATSCGRRSHVKDMPWLPPPVLSTPCASSAQLNAELAQSRAALAAGEAAKNRLQDTVDGLTAQVTEEARAASELRRQVADLRSQLSTYGATLNA